MTKQELLDELRRLSPRDRAKVVIMAQTIRAARDAGDMRPAETIIAPILAPVPKKRLH